MAREDVEWAERKIGALIEAVIGFIMMPGSFLLLIAFEESGIFYNEMAAIFFVCSFFICGLAIFLHGYHNWRKISHIVWTKQAIREYEDKKVDVEEARRHVVSSRKCPSCGATAAPDDIFCTQCGHRIPEGGE